MPYRSVGWEERAEAPRDPGIVGDVIAQFADRYAFLRELVQNAIDAGTDSVEVRLHYAPEERAMRVTVRDQGEGMTREIVEDQLLVLFRSTKEKDDSKIGKFGIGFASVLSPGPRLVVVQTARGGRRLTMHLHPDLTYQLFDGGAATRTGTSVELELAMASDEAAAELVEKSREALERWCRHAAVPIYFTAVGVGEPGAPQRGSSHGQGLRIDRPLALDGALAWVRDTTDEGKLLAVVGVAAAGAEPYAGFFNHGLMLHETAAPLLGRLSFKIQDPRLGHTLSRDDVRRDDRFHRALAFARQLAEQKLPAQVAAELRRAADEGELDRYQALALAIEEAELELHDGEWVVPLVEPMAGQRSISTAGLGRRTWVARRSSRLTALLARVGVPVLALGAGVLRQRLIARLASSGTAVAELEDELTLVQLVEPSAGEFVLLDELRLLLEAAHRAPSSISLARLEGAGDDELAIAGGVKDAVHAFPGGAPDAASAEPFALDRETIKRSPFAKLRSSPLLLSAAHPLVKAACAGEPRLAASHLARALLLHYRLLTTERSELILTHVLDRMGVS